jgi:restriction endonuclease S subunit
MGTWNIINLSEIRPDRVDAEYFHIDYSKNIEMLTKTGSVTTLGKIFKKIDRGEKAAYLKLGPIPVLRSVNIRALDFNEIRQEYVSEAYYTEKVRGKVLKDDILITSTGTGTLGRTSIWPTDNKAFNVPENSFLRAPINVDPYMVAAFLNTGYGIQQLFQNQRGSSGQLHLYPVDIKKVVIPECLFPYQEEIGEKVRRAFEFQSLSKEFYQEANKLLEHELGLDKIIFERPKTFHTYFSAVASSIRLDSNHYQPKFDQLIKHLKSNFQYSKIGYIASYNTRGLQPVYIKNGPIDVVNSKHITKTHLKYDNFEKTSLKEFEKCIPAQIQYGDVLIYTTGAYVGLTNVYLRNKEAIASNHVNILRFNDSSIDTAYIALLFNSIVGTFQTEKYIRGSAQAELYPNDIAKFIIPILPQEKMNLIGDKLRRSLENETESKKLLEQAKAQVEQIIEQSIQANA